MTERYTAEQVEDLVGKLERAGERQRKNAGQVVRLRAAERDLLKFANVVRDMIATLIQGDKQHLLALFDGESTFLYRMRAVVDLTELSEFNSKCDDMQKLNTQVTLLEELMGQIGKGFRMKTPKRAPESISYPGWSPDMGVLCPGAEVNVAPEVVGTVAEALEWSISPPLPAGLSLDTLSGRIAGASLPGVEVGERKYTVTASNAAGSAIASIEFAVREPAPEAFEYPRAARECVTGDHVRWAPELRGGRPATFSVSPPLPLGLVLDPRSGLISGFALAPVPSTKYAVTASNASGSTAAELELQVKVAPPVALTYPEFAPTIQYGGVVYLTPEVDYMRIVTDVQKAAKWGRIFSSSGAFVGTKWGKARQVLLGHVIQLADMPELAFSIEPALPPGLCLASTTGVISGKPEKEMPRTRYTVTVSNDGGSVTANLLFAVKLEGPKALMYPDAKDVVFTGDAVAMEPEVQGIVYNWRVDGELPAGLTLDDTMGTISGVPTSVCPKTICTVVARNSAGEASAKVAFVVQRQPPKNLCYRDAALEYPVGRDLDIRPTVDGEVDEYSVEPALSSGLRLDAESGTISGTPTESATMRSFVVTAKNDSGSTTAVVSFSVSMLPPVDLSYPQVDDVYGVGEHFALKPQVAGGATAWSVDPPLPEGVDLDQTTGEIRGSPKAACEEQAYTVAAENEAGGTAVVIRFRVVNRKPERLEYPEVGEGGTFDLMAEVVLEPRLTPDFGARYVVHPPLPEELAIDEETGVIRGTMKQLLPEVEYIVTAGNNAGSTSCTLRLAVVLPEPELAPEGDEDGEGGNALSFAAQLDNIKHLKDLPKNPTKNGHKSYDWMLWMVHRVYLNDPELDVVDFTNANMPLPHMEPRIAPKLMKAMATNTHVRTLILANSNLRKPQGMGLAEALRQNKTLEILNVETNYLDSERIQAMAQAMIDNPDSVVTTWRFDTQKDTSSYGRCVEEKLAELAQKNPRLLKLGFQCKDQHWLNVINRSLMANQDAARRSRKAQNKEDSAGGAEHAEAPEKPKEPDAVTRPLAKLMFTKPPEKAAWEIFDDGDSGVTLLRQFAAEKSALPSKDQLQKFAKANGKSLSYKVIASVLIDFRAKLVGAYLEQEVTMYEGLNPFVGVLRAWDERNDRFSFDLWTKDGGRVNFTTQHQPPMEVSKEIAEWIAPEEKRLGDDGVAYTFSEFVSQYADSAQSRWDAAATDW